MGDSFYWTKKDWKTQNLRKAPRTHQRLCAFHLTFGHPLPMGKGKKSRFFPLPELIALRLGQFQSIADIDDIRATQTVEAGDRFDARAIFAGDIPDRVSAPHDIGEIA